MTCVIDKDGNLLGKKNYLTMLQHRFVLEVQISKYADALGTFENIKTQDDSAKTVEHLQQYVSQVEQFLSGKKPIVMAGKI